MTASMGVGQFFKSHVWVPILISCGLAALIVFIVWCVCWRRQRRRPSYMPLPGSVSVHVSSSDGDVSESLELGQRSSEYKHRGSRKDKNWFLVREPGSQEDLLLSMLPNSTTFAPPFTNQTVKTLRDVFSTLKHPYVQPIQGVGFDYEQGYTMLVQPFSSKGSLKDLIYKASPLERTSKKYSKTGKPLNGAIIATYGRQILEALQFLKNKGFPPCTSLHTGNVIVYSRVCRVSGHELSLLGYVPKLKKAIDKKDRNAWETILFGHIIFEMATGGALPNNTSSLSESEYEQCRAHPEMIQVLKFIFKNESGQFPLIEEVSCLPFFANVALMELQTFDPSSVVLSSSGKSLLKAVRKSRPQSARRSKSSKQSEDRGSEVAPKTSSRAPPRTTNSRQPSNRHSTTSVHTTPAPQAAPKPISSSRRALLDEILAGSELKKSIMNDRSAPRV